jgi:hypothetical protein
MPAQLTTLAVVPLRVNFAGYCVWCGQRSCESPTCIERFAASVWIVCPDCDGSMEDREGDSCRCYGGVIEGARPGMTFPPSWVTASPISAPPARACVDVDPDDLSCVLGCHAAQAVAV